MAESIELRFQSSSEYLDWVLNQDVPKERTDEGRAMINDSLRTALKELPRGLRDSYQSRLQQKGYEMR